MSTRPNILTIVWHDAGRWFGCYGNRQVHTTHVDRLADEGVRFANCFAAAPLCSPSRAALFTGRLCQRNGVMYLANEARDNSLTPDSVHLSRLLQGAGYRSARFGTLHECCHEHIPLRCGFDSMHACDPWPQAPVVAEAFEHWARALPDDGRPFYAQIGLFEAHTPWDFQGIAGDDERGIALPPFLADSERNRHCLRDQQGALRVGDAAIGHVLGVLDELGLGDDTIVCMQVDHGIDVPRAKCTCYDPGLEVAWLLRWRAGGLARGHVVDQLCTHVDVLPTLCALAGIDPPTNVDGHSFAEHARDATRAERRDAVFSSFVGAHRSIRTREHKLIRNFGRQPDHCARRTLDLAPAVPRTPPGRIELYALAGDPDEFHDLAADTDHAALRDELDGRLWDFLLDSGDFAPHLPVRSEWDLATRRDLEAHCRRSGRTPPPAVGPRVEPHIARFDQDLASTRRYFEQIDQRYGAETNA